MLFRQIYPERTAEKLYGEGGVYAYLGTNNMKEIEIKAKEGNESVKLIYNAMIYQICKEIEAMASVLSFDMDRIIITGGLAKDEDFQITVADIDEGKLNKLTKETGIRGIKADLSSSEAIRKIVADQDIVIGAVPGF